MYKISLTYVPTNIFDIPEALVVQSVCNASPRGHRELLDGRLFGKLTFLENSFNKDKSVGL